MTAPEIIARLDRVLRLLAADPAVTDLERSYFDAGDWLTAFEEVQMGLLKTADPEALREDYTALHDHFGRRLEGWHRVADRKIRERFGA